MSGYKPRTHDEMVGIAATYYEGLTGRREVHDPRNTLNRIFAAAAAPIAELARGMTGMIMNASTDGVFRAFSFSRRPALKAYGKVLFEYTGSSPLASERVIPPFRQLVASQNGKRFELMESRSLLPAPGAAPSLTALAAGGAMTTNDYFVAYTFLTVEGESGLSPAASVSVTGPTGAILVQGAALPAGATGMQLYIGTAADTLKKSVSSVSNSVTAGAIPDIGAPPPPVRPYTYGTAVATSSGVSGNTDANTIIEISPSVTEVSVINPQAFVNGADEETDTERLTRFTKEFEGKDRGSLSAAEVGARMAALYDANDVITERVVDAFEEELWESDIALAGRMKIYIWNGVGTASAALLAEVMKILKGYTDENGKKTPGYKAGGVAVELVSVTTQNVPITINTIKQTGSLSDPAKTIEDGVRRYFSGLAIGDGEGRGAFIKNKLVDMLMSLPGIENFVLEAPGADIVPAKGVVLVPTPSITV